MVGNIQGHALSAASHRRQGESRQAPVARAVQRAGRGALTSNYAEGGAFLKTRPDLAMPDIQLHFVVALTDNHARTLHLGHGLSCHVCLLRPKSRGEVTLESKDAHDAPRIDPAFFNDPRDLDGMVEGFKLARRLMHAPALAEWITKDLFTANVNSDDAIRDALKRRVDTVYHPAGTCRMGRDTHAVVDAQLCVRGLQGLRVVDASVMPTLIGGNTNAPIIMIAEKAVDMIKGVPRARLPSLDTIDRDPARARA